MRTIAILPPEAEFVRVTLSDNTRDAESESLVQKKLAEVTPKLLAEKGYAVTTELIPIAGTAGGPLNLYFEKIKLELANATRKLYEQDASDVEARNLKINLGASARAMAAAANADALMLVAYSEKKPSVGVVVASVAVGVALGVITNGNLPSGGSKPCKVQSTLIDGRTGDVLWLNVQATSECRNYLKAMGDALERLPHAHYR